jgi:hypothetical protein
MHDYPVYFLAQARQAELKREAEVARHVRAARGRWARRRAHRSTAPVWSPAPHARHA